MSLRKNILASYASQFYVALIGIVMVPLYIRYMGAEAYGLVGFYAMLQAWFMLLDMGLTPTIARETARFRGGARDAASYRRLVRTLEGVFLVAALVGGSALFTISGYIARDWLNVSQLPQGDVKAAVQLMTAIVAMRWMSGLYRGAISGSERLVWLGSFDMAIATLRFVGVLLVFAFINAAPQTFFGYQLCVAVAELTALLLYAYRLFPKAAEPGRSSWSLAPLGTVLKFSLAIAFTSSVWVVVTQTDKLVLSKVLPLAEYGYFTVAVLVAGLILMICSPISNALLPRMSTLEAQGDQAGLIRVYRKTTQLVAVLAGSASVTVALCAEPLLWAWTGDRHLAHQAAPILRLYALGNGILAVAAFPYYLQYAKGDLRLHLIGNAGFVVLLVPIIVWAASRYGALGAGYTWLGMNLLSFVAWLPLVHRKFVPGLNAQWYGKDVLVIVAAAVAAALALGTVLPVSEGRWTQFAIVIATGAVVVLASAAASSEMRARLNAFLLVGQRW